MTSTQSSERRIPFTCPYCGHHTAVDAKFAGHTGPCVGCSNPVTVPRIEALVATSFTAPQRQPKPIWVKAGMIVGALAAVAVVGVIAWSILQPAIVAARGAAQCSKCETNLRQIGMALEDYYQEHNEYPPAIVYDKNGKAKHSWRVLLLPHLGPEAKKVYELYDMDEPWDSTKNSALIREMPNVYRCPSDEKAIKGETSYLAVVGPRTVINRDAPVRMRGQDGPILTDDPAETLVLIEASGSTVNWLEPKDIPVAALRAGLNSTNPASPGSEHDQGVNVLMADLSVLRLQDTVSSDDLQAMSTIDGQDEYIEVLDEMGY